MVAEEDDVPFDAGAPPCMTNQALGDHSAVVGQGVLQVGRDGAPPVDVGVPWTSSPRSPMEGAADALERLATQPLLELVGHRPHHCAGGAAAALWDGVV